MRSTIRSLASRVGLALILTASAAHGADTPPDIDQQPVVRLITERQYQNAIRDAFGDIKSAIRLPPLRRLDGLSTVGAGSAVVPAAVLRIFQSSAREVSAQVVDSAHRETLIPCKPRNVKSADEACSRIFFAKAGRLLFRRTLTAQELEMYSGAANQAAISLQDFYAGVAYSLSGMLIAPEFVFLTETSEPDPQRPGARRLDAASKAMRLSLFLWDSPPDEELLRVAERGELHTEQGLAAQVDRLISSPKLERGVRSFFDDMLHLSTFNDLTKDPVIYPAFTLRVAADAKEQILRTVVDHLVVQQGDYRDLFTTRRVFLTPSLAAIYRLPVSTPGPFMWAAYDLREDDPRAGLLAQVGFLAANSHPGRSSPTLRGKAVRELFMCQTVPAPPPNVDFTAVETPDPAIKTARERLTVHMTTPSCAGCHKLTDPIGLAFENFDGAGQYRKDEKGAAIDASGSISGVDFSSASDLGVAIKNLPAIRSCVIRKLYQYGTGQQAGKKEKPVLSELEEVFNRENGKFVAVVRHMALSKTFYYIDNEPEAQTASLRERQ